MKKLFAAFLALVMMMSLLSVTAFAAEKTYKISVPDDDTHTYDVYQIFTGDLSEDGKVLSNVKWGQNGIGEEGNAVDQTILDELEVVKDASTPEKLAVINEYFNDQSEKLCSVNNDQSYDAVPGYYLIKDTADFEPGEEDSYSTYIVKVVNNVEIARKADIPTVDKEIVEGTATAKVNEASIGDTVNYQITGTLPENLAHYATYFYQFNDTLSKGLTYNNDMVVTVKNEGKDDVDVTKYFYKNASPYSETTGTTINVSIKNLLALNNVTGITVNNKTEIVLTYSATLNENAVIAGEGNPNDVYLEYSNNPNKSGTPDKNPPPETPDKPEPVHPTGETPKDTVVTYTTKLTIQKTDENGDALTGAEFELTGDGVKYMVVSVEKFVEDASGAYWKLTDGTYTTTAPVTAEDETNNRADYVSVDTKYSKTTTTDVRGKDHDVANVKAFVKEDGTLTFSGLGAGDYTLTETTTPDGYNTIAPIKFTVSFNANNKTFSATDPIVLGSEANTLYTKIVNHSGATLPETGGIGTTIFYVVGGLLLVGAAVMLVAKKRMDGEN